MPPKSRNNWHTAEMEEQFVKRTPHLVLLQEYEEVGEHHHPDHLAVAE
jgi:hypothetical protein